MSVGNLGPGPVVVAQLQYGYAGLVTDATGQANGVAPSGWSISYDPHGFVVTDHFQVPASFLPDGKYGIFAVSLAVDDLSGPSPIQAAVTSVVLDVRMLPSDPVENQARLEVTGLQASGSARAMGSGTLSAMWLLQNLATVTLQADASVVPAVAGAHLGASLNDWTIVYLGLADV